jgi:hypothetical protein
MKRVDEYQRDVVMMSKINESDQRTEKLKKDKEDFKKSILELNKRLNEDPVINSFKKINQQGKKKGDKKK